jgi:hypothetical protein
VKSICGRTQSEKKRRETNKRNNILWCLFIALAYLMMHSAALTAYDQPAISKVNGLVKASIPQCRLLELKDLDGDLQKYISLGNSSAHPGFVNADFDGNGTEDYAVLLICGKGKHQTIQFAVFMANKNNSYSCIKINKWNEELYLKNLYLDYVKRGNITETETERVVKIINDGVSLNLFEAASQVYYWKNGNFSHIQTSD